MILHNTDCRLQIGKRRPPQAPGRAGGLTTKRSSPKRDGLGHGSASLPSSPVVEIEVREYCRADYRLFRVAYDYLGVQFATVVRARYTAEARTFFHRRNPEVEIVDIRESEVAA